MRVRVFGGERSLASSAASEAASRIRAASATRGRARLVAATGNSQMAFLEALIQCRDLDWSRVDLFHLDEYLGLSDDHPASFRRYLLDRLVRPAAVAAFHPIEGERD